MFLPNFFQHLKKKSLNSFTITRWSVILLPFKFTHSGRVADLELLPGSKVRSNSHAF